MTAYLNMLLVKEFLMTSDASVKRTFWLTPETDLALRLRAIKENKKFSVIAEEAFRYFRVRR
jgi:hypothetical protein